MAGNCSKQKARKISQRVFINKLKAIHENCEGKELAGFDCCAASERLLMNKKTRQFGCEPWQLARERLQVEHFLCIIEDESGEKRQIPAHRKR
jgi:hypothetical protein